MNFQTKAEALSYIYGAVFATNRLAAQDQLLESVQEAEGKYRVLSMEYLLGILDYAGIQHTYHKDVQVSGIVDFIDKKVQRTTKKIDLFWGGDCIAVLQEVVCAKMTPEETRFWFYLSRVEVLETK